MKKFSTILLEDVNDVITFGDEEPVEEFEDLGVFELPIQINGIEYSTDELKLVVEPQTIVDRNGVEKTLYRLDINLLPQFRHKGYGYKIYKEFVLNYGNLIDRGMNRENFNEMPKIFDKLSREPGINVKHIGDDILVCTDEWKEKYGMEIE